MYKITKQDINFVEKEFDWPIADHINRIYNRFRFRAGNPPDLFTEPGENVPAIKKFLIGWNADLGARHLIDWKEFLRLHRLILTPLTKLKIMGQLKPKDIDLICKVVRRLDKFKPTKGRSLVFGSKAAHFHFPGLVPVMSSEVRKGLNKIEKKYRKELRMFLPTGKTGTCFKFTTPENRLSSYKNYISFGNHLMRNINTNYILGEKAPKYSLNAKIYEWSVVRQAFE